MRHDVERNLPVVLLVGPVPAPGCSRAADGSRPVAPELQLPYRLACVDEVYAAIVRLFNPHTPRPAVIVADVESLRGDELRFFDLLSRRFEDVVAAAVYSGSPEDRRLEACRRRGAVVLHVSGLNQWLAAQVPTVPAVPCKIEAPAAQKVEAVPPPEPGDPPEAPAAAPSSEQPTAGPEVASSDPSPDAAAGDRMAPPVSQAPSEVPPAMDRQPWRFVQPAENRATRPSDLPEAPPAERRDEPEPPTRQDEPGAVDPQPENRSQTDSGDNPHHPLAGVEVTLDLPDELVDLGELDEPHPEQAAGDSDWDPDVEACGSADESDLDEAEVHLADQTDYAETELPDLADEADDPAEYDRPEDEDFEDAFADAAGPSDPDDDSADVDDEDRANEADSHRPGASQPLPLTPWSSVPRVQRRPPRRPAVPPGGNGGPGEGPKQGSQAAGEGAEPAGAPGQQASAVPQGQQDPPPQREPVQPPPRDWEHGLLTPDELRALLSEPDESSDGQEGRG